MQTSTKHKIGDGYPDQSLRAHKPMHATKKRHMKSFLTPRNLIYVAIIAMVFIIIVAVVGNIKTGYERQQEEVQPDDTDIDKIIFESLYSLANASVYEEIITRVLWLGIPLLVVHAVSGGLRNKFYRYFLGGKFHIDGPIIVLIVFSGVIFGLGHSGWGYWWKVIQTMVGGLIFGYLFVKHGVHAAIVFHFTVDYLSAIIFVVFTNLSFGSLFLYFIYAIFLGYATSFWLVAGAFYSTVYLARIGEFFKRRLGRTRYEEPPDEPIIVEPIPVQPVPVKPIYSYYEYRQ